METLRPEWNLLLRCARVRLGPGEEGALEEAARRVSDWNLLLRLAVRHRVAPLVFHNLSRRDARRVPPDFLGRLRSRHLGNLAGNVRAARALTEVMTVFEQAGIRAAAYKGPVLAVWAYGSLGLRMFNDLDVFVDRRAMTRALECLAGMGYRMEGPVSSLSPAALRLLRDVVLRDRTGHVVLEVQWRLAQRYHPAFRDPGEVWRRTTRVGVEGFPLRTFSPEDTLILLCLHGLYHAWSQLQMVSDVAECLRLPTVDAELVLDLARGHGAERILFLGLNLARGLLAAPVPPRLLDAAGADTVSTSLAADIGRRFFDPELAAVRARRFFFREAMMLPGPVSRVRYFIGRLLTPNEEDLAGGIPPRAVLGLYPVRRLLRLFRSYVLRENGRERERTR